MHPFAGGNKQHAEKYFFWCLFKWVKQLIFVASTYFLEGNDKVIFKQGKTSLKSVATTVVTFDWNLSKLLKDML